MRQLAKFQCLHRKEVLTRVATTTWSPPPPTDSFVSILYRTISRLLRCPSRFEAYGAVLQVTGTLKCGDPAVVYGYGSRGNESDGPVSIVLKLLLENFYPKLGQNGEERRSADFLVKNEEPIRGAQRRMGAFLDKPKTDKFLEQGEGNGIRYGVASMQGWRVEMEDAHMAKTNLGGALKDWSYFAVFDGHAGAKVSAHCADHLLEAIMATEEFQEDVMKGIHNGFLQLDNKMRTLPEMSSGEDKSGTTAVCAFISPRLIYIANCGDSRAVLCRAGAPVFSTQDHKPGLTVERERIVKAGGSVMLQRVNGSLAVSRALGDYEYKNVEGMGPCEQLVSPEPEIFVRDRDDVEDEFLVLACDGIWDVMTNEDLCQYIHSRLLLTSDLSLVTSQVIDTCLYKGSRDNMSIVLVVFPGAPQPSAEAIQAEKELDATLEKSIKEIVENSTDIDFPEVVNNLLDLHLKGLPPGGGLAAKRTYIDQIYKQLCPEQAHTAGPGYY